MSYDGKILKQAMEQFENQKATQNQTYEAKRDWIYAKNPRIETINHELSCTVGKIMAQALRAGADPKAAVAKLQEENVELRRERAELLTELGVDMDFFERMPGCPLCHDTGFVNGVMCRCLRTFYTREQNKSLSKLLNLGEQSFDTFRFDYYPEEKDYRTGISPRENIELVYEVCSDYAHNFLNKEGNLFLSGAPGLEKTFLSACIAREVSEMGASVVYDTAGHIFAQMEECKFGEDEDNEAKEDIRRFLEADLLIMDDLGTEMVTTFIVSALYQVVNTRLMNGKKTIINSNLTVDEVTKRYGAAIGSRLEGEYTVLPFFGKDIRQQKKENG